MKLSKYFAKVDETITGHWTKGYLFRDARKELTLKQSEAEYFCILGALKFNSALISSAQFDKARKIIGTLVGQDVRVWNDAKERKEEDVHALLGRAAAEAWKEENKLT